MTPFVCVHIKFKIDEEEKLEKYKYKEWKLKIIVSGKKKRSCNNISF